MKEVIIYFSENFELKYLITNYKSYFNSLVLSSETSLESTKQQCFSTMAQPAIKEDPNYEIEVEQNQRNEDELQYLKHVQNILDKGELRKWILEIAV